MSDNILNEFKQLTQHYDDNTTNFIVNLIKNDEFTFQPSKEFFFLANNNNFINQLFEICINSNNEAVQKKAIDILTILKSDSAIEKLFLIYTHNINNKFIKEIIKKNLKLHYGYGIIGFYLRIKQKNQINNEIDSLINTIVKESSYYDNLKQLVEINDEKIILYVLKQYHYFSDESIYDVLKKLSNSANWMIRFNIVQVLKKFKNDEMTNLMLTFIYDDNIKVREEAKTFIISNFSLFKDKVYNYIDNPYAISNINFLQELLEIFEYHPDLTKIISITKIIGEFPETVSLKARNVLFNILKNKFKIKDIALDRESENYKMFKNILITLLSYNFDQLPRFINKLIENFGLVYIDILLSEYFNNNNNTIQNNVIKVLREQQFYLKEKQQLLEICNTFDNIGLENFIKILVLNKVRDIILSFAKIIDELSHKKALLIYSVLSSNNIDVSKFSIKYKEIGNTISYDKLTENIEALAELKDPELPIIIKNNWKIYTTKVKNTALTALSKPFYLTENSIDTLNYIFTYENDINLKIKALEVLSDINSTNATLILLKAFSNNNLEIAKHATRILIEKGREKLFNQIETLPDDVKEKLSTFLVQNDEKFILELENKIASISPKIRNQFLKLITYLSKNDRSKATNLLKKFIKNPDPHIRADFTKLIEVIGGQEVIEYLIQLLNDENDRVRANAIEVIAALNLKEISNILLPFASHANNRVRANAIIALYKLGNPNVISGLLDMLRSDDKWMRASATYALGEIRDPRVLPILYSVLNDNDIDVIKNALKVIQKIGDSDSIKYLTKFLNHENKEIKTLASNVINNLRKENKVIKNE